MKLMICSDLHLGAQDIAANKAAALLDRISARIRENGIQVLLVAGNLTDGADPDGSVADMLDRFFLSVPETYIFITPGNTDPYNINSIYAARSWPENVKIFTGDLKAAELRLQTDSGELQPVRIYGGAYTRHFAPPELISEKRLPRLDPEYTNILLTHTPPIGKSGCIAPELLDLSGFDLCACSCEGPVDLSPASAQTVPECGKVTVQLAITGSPFARSCAERPPYFRIPDNLPVIRGQVLSGELLPGQCLLAPEELPQSIQGRSVPAPGETLPLPEKQRRTALLEYFEKTLESARSGIDPEQFELAKDYACSALAGRALIKEGSRNDG